MKALSRQRSLAGFSLAFLLMTISGQATLTITADVCMSENPPASIEVDVNGVATVTSDTFEDFGNLTVFLQASAWENSLCLGTTYSLMPGSTGAVAIRFLTANSPVSVMGPRVSGTCVECYAGLAQLQDVLGFPFLENEAGPVGGDCSTSGCASASKVGYGKGSPRAYSPWTTIFCLPE